QTNRPYVHLMSLEQDAGEEPLEQHGESYRRFLEVVRGEGSRAPDVGIVALGIDDAIESIHPKIVKRLCIGPLHAPLLARRQPPDAGDARAQMLDDLVRAHCRQEDDAVLFFTDETVFSKGEEVTRTLLSPIGKVRQVFEIEEADAECHARHASMIHRSVLLPHGLLQHLRADAQEALPQLSRCRKVTYDA